MPDTSAFHSHDHTACRNEGLAQAETIAKARGLRLTPVRRRTLEILLERHRALGAYEVLDRLAEGGFGSQPPVAYRALEFLVENGLAHRIQRLNAYTACAHPGDDHSPVFLICSSCKSVAEAPAENVLAALSEAAQGMGFSVAQSSIEAVGICPACSEGAAT
ncbi:transcriptional repressor [Pseudoruegeria sp. SHC-113]|uniref:transcriptional repressor n=1 Tax=Pseudoruegeria sp. SHC-113 TaxID=2855439 RepID=UPI0021BB659C|nr:transcriptional repressor [Pseudoruegeria sp. SHC-113]MCT8158896.1 transcriptional repressor [Pseudoruegeria sp. SHC-113]